MNLTIAAKYAKLLLGCYRTGEANDPEVYTAAIIRIMSQYPEDVLRTICDPLCGLPSKIDWLPKPKEVLSACEDIEGPRRRSREWEARTERQLAERAALGDMPRKVPERIMDELAEHGLTKDVPLRSIETPGKVMAKYGLTQAEWDAIPNGKGHREAAGEGV